MDVPQPTLHPVPYQPFAPAFPPAQPSADDDHRDAPWRQQVLAEWAHGAHLPHLCRDIPLHHLFEATAAACPAAPALICHDVTLSYAELDAHADALATALRARGVGPGHLIAFQLPRDSRMHVALLGILKSGAGYVPLDPCWPHERVDAIVRDSQASLVIVAEPCSRAAPTLVLHAPGRPANNTPASNTIVPQVSATPPHPADICYVIYTSGSTGKPKGVAVTHANVVHLVLAEHHLFAVTESDRVLAGFSIAFDAAVEETWLAFAAGAALVVATKEQMLVDLEAFIAQQGVSVFSTVPTLLATLTGDLPSVRLLILGGEALPQQLAQRWTRSGRRLVNTYGPTEATVIATACEVQPDAPVTLGRPIANYAIYILDEHGQPTEPGSSGEICIGGVGVARGYIGSQAHRTRERFMRNSFAGEWGAPRRLYHTGDLGRFDASGAIHFLGRMDEQVKIRGFRVELGEIESALLGCADIMQAAVVLRAPQQQLVAYVVPRPGATVDWDACKQQLRATLPPYCVPACMVSLAILPTLSSGKVDKKALPEPQAAASAGRHGEAPQGPLETLIASCWERLLGSGRVGRHADFFADLGGHSLLAAQMVSELRRLPQCASLSVYDVYAHPTVAGLALRCRAPEPQLIAEPVERITGWRYWACGAAQLLGLYGISGVSSAELLAPYITYAVLRSCDVHAMAALVCAAGLLLVAYPLMLLAAIAVKWAVVGRFCAGTYPLWGLTYLRFWLVQRIVAVVPTWFLHGTPLLNVYYRLMGARIGRNVHIAAAGAGCFDLLQIDDDATVGVDVDMRGFVVQDGQLIVGHTHIGAGSVVGARCVLEPDSAVGAGAELRELTRLGQGARVPPNEVWQGAPARFAQAAAPHAPVSRPSRARLAAFTAMYAVLVLLLPSFLVAALVPGLVVLFYAEQLLGPWYLVVSPLVAALFVITMCLEIVVAKWLLLGRAQPGVHPIFSGLFLRHWVFQQAMEMSLDLLGGLYATLFLNPWLRLLGVRLGKNVEVSTASGITPDLLRIDDEAFVADCVSVGTPYLARGSMTLRATHVGERSFVGNSAVVPGGTHIGNDCLLGCLSAAPDDASPDGASYFGSPAIALPQRQGSTIFSLEQTYKPTRTLVMQRLGIELLRVTLPTTCAVALVSVLMNVAVALHAHLSHGAFLALFPCLTLALGFCGALTAVVCKWLLMGRYRPGERPLWCTFIWRNELVTAMHENLADSLWNEMLLGTPYAAWFFRALGVKIGKRVYMETTQFTEYDLVNVGDDVCLNGDCTLQTHLFEDRVMKMSTIDVADACNVGRNAVVLYDTRMEPGSSLGSLSLLMKGEVLPATSRWEGSPARSAV